jgi:hypothetical protein
LVLTSAEESTTVVDIQDSSKWLANGDCGRVEKTVAPISRNCPHHQDMRIKAVMPFGLYRSKLFYYRLVDSHRNRLISVTR